MAQDRSTQMIMAALTAFALLSGCIQYESKSTSSTSSTSQCFQNGKEVPCSTTSCTINGVACSKWGTPTGPNETVSIHERVPVDTGIDRAWRFSVHPGAQTARVEVGLRGHDGQDLGAAIGHGCIEFRGPGGRTSTGNCSGGTNVQASPVLLTPAANANAMGFAKDELGVGDYAIHVTMGPALLDVAIDVDVTY